jgi:murein DD-endopeptidase MepM/ murein hydrolase activator NlpD
MGNDGRPRDVTDVATDVEIVAPAEVRDFVAARGGMRYVWISVHRGVRCTPCLFETSLRQPSKGDAYFRRIPAPAAARGMPERPCLDRVSGRRAARRRRPWHTPASVDVRTTDTRARLHASAATLLGVLAALLLLTAFAPVAQASGGASATLAEPVCAGPLAAGGRAAPAAARPGSGGWFWPVGTEDFRGWSGFLEKRGSYVHVAQDMPCAAGHAVYAVADGTVFISRADAGGYGVGGAPGGCVIIAHATASGVRFHALYGHVQGLKVKAGQQVTAGQTIAGVNGCRHLHFSVHVGFAYRDRNPYAGHVPAAWPDHGGYTDPVEFLRSNPRSAPYRPPALPAVEVTTAAVPQRYGAAAGVAYWTEEGAAGGVTWRQDLAGGQRAALGPGDAAPAFDVRRYVATLLTAPAVGFSVSDRLPALTLQVAHDTPPWGTEAQLALLLANASGVPVQGGMLKLQRLSGAAWQNVRLGVTDAAGAAVLAYRPEAATTLRVLFAPPVSQPVGREYLAARSQAVTLMPHVGLTTPKAPSAVGRDDLVTVAGDLTPEHPAGEETVRLVFQRRSAGGAWVTRLTGAALNRDVPGAAFTRYVGHARLTPGQWRVRALHPADAEHAETASSWRGFSVQ